MSERQYGRTPLYVVSVMYLVFVIYGSLVPLNFTARPIGEAIEIFRHIPFLRLGIDSRADWVANLLLFVPLSFGIAQCVRISERRSLLGAAVGYAAIWTFCSALCVGIEFTQIFFPPRVVSQNDILAESLGAGFGLVLHARWSERCEDWLARFSRRLGQQDALVHVLQGYFFVLLAYSVLPLDLTLSPADIFHKWKEGRIVLIPFGHLPRGAAAILYEIATDIGIWVPAGLLWQLTRRSRTLDIGVKGALAAFAIEFLQLFVYSRVTDVTDILMGGIGAALGASIMRFGGRHLRITQRDAMARYGTRGWWLALSAWVALVLAVFWFPYGFHFEPSFVADRLAGSTRVPFQAYYSGSEYRAATEVLHKVGFFMPGGIVWVLLARSAKHSLPAAAGLLLVASVAALVEVGQIFLPGKIADLTDWVLEFSGAALGMWLTSRVLAAPRVTENGPPRARATMHAASSATAGGQRSAAPARVATRATGADEDRIPPPVAGAAPVGRAPWHIDALAVAVLAILVGSLARLPFLPYNVKELFLPGVWALVSAAGIAIAIYWQSVAHLDFLSWASSDPARPLTLPLWIILHGIVSWVLVRIAVPQESLQDIVGSPILGWPWEWEMLLRFLALDAVVSLAALGAALIVWNLYRIQMFGMLILWLLASVFLAPLLHWVIVSQAATDNLTELMRGGGTIGSSVLLGAGLLCVLLTASGLSAGFAAPGRRLAPLIVGALAMPLAYLCVRFGTEPVIVKYDKVFSALQSLLSTDRAHYATGPELLLRYCLANIAVVVMIGLLQAPHWRHTLRRFGRRSARRGAAAM